MKNLVIRCLAICVFLGYSTAYASNAPEFWRYDAQDEQTKALKDVAAALDDACWKLFNHYQIWATALKDPSYDNPHRFYLQNIQSSADQLIAEERSTIKAKVEAAGFTEQRAEHLMKYFDTFCQRIANIYSPVQAQRVEVIALLKKRYSAENSAEIFNYNPETDPNIFDTYLNNDFFVSEKKDQELVDLFNKINELAVGTEQLFHLRGHLFKHLCGCGKLGGISGFVVGTDKVYIGVENGLKMISFAPELLAVMNAYATGEDIPSTENSFLASLPPLAPTTRAHTMQQPRFHLVERSSRCTVPNGSTLPTNSALEHGDKTSSGSVAVPTPSAPKKISLFTPNDNKMFADIDRALEKIQSRMHQEQRGFSGYSPLRESIMDYGLTEEPAPISKEVRQALSSLLHSQLTRRAVVVLPIQEVRTPLLQNTKGPVSAVQLLVDWVSEDQIFSAVDQATRRSIINSLRYLSEKSNAKTINDHLLYLTTLWQAKALYDFYQKWPAVSAAEKEEKARFQENIAMTMHHIFIAVADHNGRCAQGARGRNFLAQLALVQFFREFHPDIIVS